MGFSRGGRERQLGKGFGNADDGFELPDGDGDRGAGIGGQFGGMDLPAYGDKVRGELFGSRGGKMWGAAAGTLVSRKFEMDKGKNKVRDGKRVRGIGK